MPTRSKRISAELSPEVLNYLETRGIPIPDRPPLIRTPEPRAVRGAAFDPERVDRVIKAVGLLRHTKGKWRGRPLELAPVQIAYIVAPIFGWVRKDSSGVWRRIIRDAYIEMPRKGAKTTLASALAMYLAFADGEGGAEVLLGAASRDQAGAAFKPLAALAKSSRVLQDAGVVALKTEIRRDSDGSVCKTVSSRGDLAHGANVHGGLVDELHVHRSPDLLEAIESGVGARTQPLVIIITTADDGQTTSVYAQRRGMIEKLANRTFKAPAMYGIVWAAADNEDPFAESTWIKANPLYPETPTREFMEGAANKAKTNPVAKASFLRLHLGIRAKLDKEYLSLQRWDRNASIVDEEKLRGRVAFGGLDLSSVSDLTALSWVLPDEMGGYDTLWRFWMPESALEPLDAATARSASTWVKDGWLRLTPGDVVDYDFVKAQIVRDLARFDVQAIGYDRWNSSQLVIDLEDKEGAPMVRVGQGFAALSAPLKEVDRLVRAGTARNPMLRHGGNPVARWMASNLRVAMDAQGNVKPDKAKSMAKIDGMSALVTAMSVAMASEKPAVSAYEDDHDLIII